MEIHGTITDDLYFFLHHKYLRLFTTARDTGFVREQDRGRMLTQKPPRSLADFRGIDLHLGIIAAEHQAIEPRAGRGTAPKAAR